MQLTAEEQAEVFHLWLIDQGYPEEAMVFISQPERFNSTDLPWCAGIVVCTALGMEEDVMELLQHSCPAELHP